MKKSIKNDMRLLLSREEDLPVSACSRRRNVVGAIGAIAFITFLGLVAINERFLLGDLWFF